MRQDVILASAGTGPSPGWVTYFDNERDDYDEIRIRPKPTAIVCPVLRVVEITEEEWTKTVPRLIKIEEEMEDIPIAARNLFNIVTDTVQEVNLFLLGFTIVSENRPYDAKARYYCDSASR